MPLFFSSTPYGYETYPDNDILGRCCCDFICAVLSQGNRKLTLTLTFWEDVVVTLYVQCYLRGTGNFETTSINTRSFSNNVFMELLLNLTVTSIELLFLRQQGVNFSLIKGFKRKRCLGTMGVARSPSPRASISYTNPMRQPLYISFYF